MSTKPLAPNQINNHLIWIKIKIPQPHETQTAQTLLPVKFNSKILTKISGLNCYHCGVQSCLAQSQFKKSKSSSKRRVNLTYNKKSRTWTQIWEPKNLEIWFLIDFMNLEWTDLSKSTVITVSYFKLSLGTYKVKRKRTTGNLWSLIARNITQMTCLYTLRLPKTLNNNKKRSVRQHKLKIGICVGLVGRNQQNVGHLQL